MIEVTRIPTLRTQCPENFSMECMNGSARIAGMKRGAPLLVTFGSLMAKSGTDVHGGHQTVFRFK